MGLFASFLDSFCEHCSSQSIYTLVTVGFFSFIALSVLVNVLRQLLFKNPHEPPLVFHWFPFVGSTISYGMDPYTFFNTARAKVCTPQFLSFFLSFAIFLREFSLLREFPLPGIIFLICCST